MENTRDLMDFGTKELRLAGRLLSLLRTSSDHTMRLGDKVTPEMNFDSGYVFLIDSDFNVAMVNGDRLEDWLMCQQCATEGFVSDLEQGHPCCKAYAKESFEQK